MPIAYSITLVLCLTTCIVWMLALISSVSMRRLGRLVDQSRQSSPSPHELPGISVIITAHNQQRELHDNLPLILDQIYPRFEVIVVDMASTDGTKDVLEKLEEEHTNLRHTFTPHTSRDISLSRLAITLGIKAASHPWVLITRAECAPISHSWILHMASALTNHRSAKMVLGGACYGRTTSRLRRKAQFYWLCQQMRTLPYVLRRGACISSIDNLLYNKELFLHHQGFASHANLLTGAVEIMVNEHSTQHNTALCLRAEARLLKPAPAQAEAWKQELLFQQETQSHFKHNALLRLQGFLTALLRYACVLLLLATLGCCTWMAQQDNLWYIGTGLTLVGVAVHLIVQGTCYNYTARRMGLDRQNSFSTAWFMLGMPLWNLQALMRHLLTGRRQFRKKYI